MLCPAINTVNLDKSLTKRPNKLIFNNFFGQTRKNASLDYYNKRLFSAHIPDLNWKILSNCHGQNCYVAPLSPKSIALKPHAYLIILISASLPTVKLKRD